MIMDLEDLKNKKIELEKTKEQLVANVNYINGKLDLINELLSKVENNGR